MLPLPPKSAGLGIKSTPFLVSKAGHVIVQWKSALTLTVIDFVVVLLCLKLRYRPTKKVDDQLAWVTQPRSLIPIKGSCLFGKADSPNSVRRPWSSVSRLLGPFKRSMFAVEIYRRCASTAYAFSTIFLSTSTVCPVYLGVKPSSHSNVYKYEIM